MALSMVKLVEVKRKKWQSKIKGQVLAILGRVLLACRKKQERNQKKQENANPSLPDDLVEEILHRLPVKTLVRLKSVSKEWKSMMESSYLAERHLRCLVLEKKYEEMKITVQKSKNSLCVKFFSKCGRVVSCEGSSEGRVRVAGSCNGLVCVHELDSVNVYLCNPMTGVTRTLTPPPDHANYNKVSVGFGIDVVTGTYKVVLFYYGFFRLLETLVFDFGTSKWRPRHKTAGPIPLSCVPSRDRNPVFVNGSLFWLLENDSSEILVLDLHTEMFRTLSTSNDMGVLLGDIYIFSFENRLCFFHFRQIFRFMPAASPDYVWVLVEDERWERITYRRLGIRNPPISLDSAWFSQTLVSPYQSSSSTCIIGYRQSDGDTRVMDAPIELMIPLF
ncbi:unnamed protein product [Eruca vesicaria subsp. sativa]|uniref:F-box domain-containing protein n=1 Tax=Eruca vesicaria subsp. sativa TaxID=29727 RepID=A0ABC8LUI0_ERUVS|nr:unnamed protein product [Eruca vesicaria subsp. sativa]